MSPTPKPVDQKCVDLAEHFMEGVKGHTPAHVRELAEAVQDICEGHCNMAEADTSEARRDADNLLQEAEIR